MAFKPVTIAWPSGATGTVRLSSASLAALESVTATIANTTAQRVPVILASSQVGGGSGSTAVRVTNTTAQRVPVTATQTGTWTVGLSTGSLAALDTVSLSTGTLSALETITAAQGAGVSTGAGWRVTLVNPTTGVSIVSPTTAVRVTNTTGQRVPVNAAQTGTWSVKVNDSTGIMQVSGTTAAHSASNPLYTHDDYVSFAPVYGAVSTAASTYSAASGVRMWRVSNFSTETFLLVASSGGALASSRSARVGQAASDGLPNSEVWPITSTRLYVRAVSGAPNVSVEAFR